jgi:hypothetical protein
VAQPPISSKPTTHNEVHVLIDNAINAAEGDLVQRVTAQHIYPAVDHLRKLNTAHQAVISTMLEDRCCRCEAMVEAAAARSEQHINDLRVKLQALRSDARSALAVMAGTLSIAAPSL